MTNNEASKICGGSIRFSEANYDLVRQLAKASSRSMTGQVEWMVRLLSVLQKEYTDIFVEISNKLEQQGFN